MRLAGRLLVMRRCPAGIRAEIQISVPSAGGAAPPPPGSSLPRMCHRSAGCRSEQQFYFNLNVWTDLITFLSKTFRNFAFGKTFRFPILDKRVALFDSSTMKSTFLNVNLPTCAQSYIRSIKLFLQFRSLRTT